MKTRFVSHIVLAAAAAATLGGAMVQSSFASPITWLTPTTISADTDVVKTGSLVSAYVFAAAATTVNTVTFTHFIWSGSHSSPLYLGNNTTLAASGTPSDTLEQASVFSSPSGISSAYQMILDNAAYLSTNGTGPYLTLTLGDLTSGHNYQVELWLNDYRGFGLSTTNVGTNYGNINGRFETVASGNSATVNYNATSGSPNYTGTGPGQFVVGTFTASGTSEVITLTPGNPSAGTINAQLNAFQVRTLPAPEPAALAMLAVGGAGILLARRRKA